MPLRLLFSLLCVVSGIEDGDGDEIDVTVGQLLLSDGQCDRARWSILNGLFLGGQDGDEIELDIALGDEIPL